MRANFLKKAGRAHTGMFLTLCLAIPASVNARAWPESRTATVYSEGNRLPYLPMGGTIVNRNSCSGEYTILESVQTLAKIPRHDVDMGRTRLVLRTKDGKILLDETLNEVWECLGYNPRTRRYLVTSTNEHGVKVTLRGLVYIDETSAVFKESMFGKRQFHAVSSLYKSDSGYLALIGWGQGEGEEEDVQLYALDTNTDQLKVLGTAPAPPPLSPEERKSREARLMLWPWNAPERHYTKLDESIWSFTDSGTLRVSYGPDTIRKRSKQRTEKRWDLDELFRQSDTIKPKPDSTR
jgi:hypothetical protein